LLRKQEFVLKFKLSHGFRRRKNNNDKSSSKRSAMNHFLHHEQQARTLAAKVDLELKEVETLADVLKFRGEQKSKAALRFIHLDKDDWDPFGPEIVDGDSQLYSASDILESASKAADYMLQRGISKGCKVLIVLPTGPGFMATFMACQLLGAVPVPAVPPYGLNRLDEYFSKTSRLVLTSEATGIVTCRKLLPLFKAARPDRGARAAFQNLMLDKELLKHQNSLTYAHDAHPDDIAMIQFTSGSTGQQKGVVLSHRNLLSNIRAIGEAAKFIPSDVSVGWLPLYHDMGLIGNLLTSLVWGMPVVLLPPLHFIRRPSSWLKAMHDYKGTLSAAPNFAYSLCVKKVSNSALAEFDLSSWRLALSGAEPVDPRTVKAFIEKFSACQFDQGAFFPVYGMAESCLAVSFPPIGRGPKFEHIDRRRFENTGEALAAQSEDETLTCVSVGFALPHHELRIVGENGAVLAEARLGEIEIRGPSLMQGYYKNEAATAEVMRAGGWLRTGDLGFLKDGELYVTGRRKEMIIKGGKNYFPQDIEAAAAGVKGVRVGCSAAFGLWNSKRGTEDMILVCETRLAQDDPARQDLAYQIRRKVQQEIGASPDVIFLVALGTVPKTSSGKIQRGLTRKRYMANDLTPGRKPLATLARFAFYEIVERVRTGLKRIRGD
jgi:fatty-acyl-CoA synthase